MISLVMPPSMKEQGRLAAMEMHREILFRVVSEVLIRVRMVLIRNIISRAVRIWTISSRIFSAISTARAAAEEAAFTAAEVPVRRATAVSTVREQAVTAFMVSRIRALKVSVSGKAEITTAKVQTFRQRSMSPLMKRPLAVRS